MNFIFLKAPSINQGINYFAAHLLLSAKQACRLSNFVKPIYLSIHKPKHATRYFSRHPQSLESSQLYQSCLPQFVKALSELGVTRYRVDYVAATATTYIDGSSETDVAPLPLTNMVPGTNWDAEDLVRAIRGAQNGTIGGYYQFSVAAIAASVTDYTCYINGQRVVYNGALGDAHSGWFPGVKSD